MCSGSDRSACRNPAAGGGKGVQTVEPLLLSSLFCPQAFLGAVGSTARLELSTCVGDILSAAEKASAALLFLRSGVRPDGIRSVSNP